MAGYGKLYIVATPIGNLLDVTLRAIETLHKVDLILAEDTRKTKILLERYKIHTEISSYRDQNHNKVYLKILSELKEGKNLALVSDSGTPLISDPGFKLVRELKEEGIEIISIPGPCSITASLCISGIATDKFTFLGFLPKGKSKRIKILNDYGNLESSLVIFESPYRISRLLHEIKENIGNRQVFIARELTKKYEEKLTGKVSELIQKLGNKKCKGEFTLIVSKADN